jgi:hypothetical protein
MIIMKLLIALLFTTHVMSQPCADKQCYSCKPQGVLALSIKEGKSLGRLKAYQNIIEKKFSTRDQCTKYAEELAAKVSDSVNCNSALIKEGETVELAYDLHAPVQGVPADYQPSKITLTKKKSIPGCPDGFNSAKIGTSELCVKKVYEGLKGVTASSLSIGTKHIVSGSVVYEVSPRLVLSKELAFYCDRGIAPPRTSPGNSGPVDELIPVKTPGPLPSVKPNLPVPFPPTSTTTVLPPEVITNSPKASTSSGSSCQLLRDAKNFHNCEVWAHQSLCTGSNQSSGSFSLEGRTCLELMGPSNDSSSIERTCFQNGVTQVGDFEVKYKLDVVPSIGISGDTITARRYSNYAGTNFTYFREHEFGINILSTNKMYGQSLTYMSNQYARAGYKPSSPAGCGVGDQYYSECKWTTAITNPLMSSLAKHNCKYVPGKPMYFKISRKKDLVTMACGSEDSSSSYVTSTFNVSSCGMDKELKLQFFARTNDGYSNYYRPNLRFVREFSGVTLNFTKM